MFTSFPTLSMSHYNASDATRPNSAIHSVHHIAVVCIPLKGTVFLLALKSQIFIDVSSVKGLRGERRLIMRGALSSVADKPKSVSSSKSSEPDESESWSSCARCSEGND